MPEMQAVPACAKETLRMRTLVPKHVNDIRPTEALSLLLEKIAGSWAMAMTLHTHG